MPMKFSSVLKGQVAQTTVATLLERAGYDVTLWGIEVLIASIKHMDLETYHRLNLPKELRCRPDFLVTDTETGTAVSLEVKFRRAFNNDTSLELADVLAEQRQFWPDCV